MRRLALLAVVAACGGGTTAVDDPPLTAPTALRFEVPPASALAGQPLGVEVAIVDIDGTPVVSTAGPVEVALDGTSVELGGDASRFTSLGVATFADLHVDVPGTYTLTANGDGLPAITSAPFDIAFGPPSSVGSTVVASPKTLDADGALATTVTVRAANEFGVAIPGAPIALAVDGSGNVLGAASGVADASGVLTTTLASTVAEPKTITATIGPATATGTMTFVDLCRLAFDAPPLFRLSSTSSIGEVAGDFDGDGALDVATVDTTGKLVVGIAPREVVSPFGTSFGVQQLLAADLDHDGKLDVVARVNDTVVAALGKGDGSFGAAVTTALPGTPFDLAVGDFDHDNHPDLVAALTSSKQIAILHGTGTGTFTQTLLAAGNQPAFVAVGDFTGDGKDDVVVADGLDFKVGAYVGNGAGGFAAPILSTENVAGPIVVSDFDRNGALDFAMLGQSGDAVTIYLGNKAGKFTIGASVSGFGGTSCVRLGDASGDGIVDLVGCNGMRIARGNGDGTFVVGQPVNLVERIVALADVDGDGKQDAVIDAGSFLGVARSLGTTFDGPLGITGTSSPILSATADFDGDTFPDIAWEGGALLSRPGGNLVPGPIAPNDDPSAGLVAVADFDGNGAPDLVVASTSSADNLEILLNDGTATFHRGAEPAPFGIAYDAIAAGDFDFDGHPDVAVASPFGDVFVLFDNGDGTSVTPLHVAFTNGNAFRGQLVAADLDGDGFVDLVTANDSGVKVFHSVGNRTFELPVTLHAGGARVGVADVDGDGTLDIVAVGSFPAELYRGVGDATFDGPLPAGFDAAVGEPQLADVDGDGALDVVEVAGGVFEVAQGYGDGTFHAMRPFAFATGEINTLASHVLIDLDRDGRLDVVALGGVVGNQAVATQRACLAK